MTSMTAELLPPPSVADLRDRQLIRGAVMHLANDQPLLVDLFGLPSPAEPTLICTNVRSMTGKRPVWADHIESLFYFPWIHIRFVEIPPNATEVRPALAAGPTNGTGPLPAHDPEPELEIDEEFLRRVREA